MNRVIILWLILFATPACERLWDAGNRGTLTRHVAELLQNHGVEARGLECRMVGTSRAGECTVQLTDQEAQRVISGLGLRREEESLGGKESGHQNLEVAGGLKSTSQEPKSAAMAVFGIFGSPANLRLKDGSAFDFFKLVITPGLNGGKIRVAYSYG
jgi:hypothetical protein